MTSEPIRDPVTDDHWARVETVPDVVDVVLTTRLLKTA
jgi:hypothetical protein